MSKGKGSSSSANIDPFALAQAQTQSNIATAQTQAALNNSNVSAPTGTSTWTPYTDPTTGQTRYTLTQQLSPQLQQLYGTEVGGAQGLAGLTPGLAQTGQAFTGESQALLGPAAGAARNVPTSLDLRGVPTAPTLSMADFATNVPQGPIQSTVSQPLPITSNIGPTGIPITTSVGASSPQLVAQAQNAAYGAQTQYLDPQFAEQQSNLKQQLADQGINPGSAAYDRAMGDFNRSKTFAYQSAQNSAVAAGNQQEQALYGQALSSAQLQNSAQAQAFIQRLQGAGFSNAAAQQAFQNMVAMGQFSNQAQQQQFTQGLSLADLYNQARLGVTNQGNTAAQMGLQRAQAQANQPMAALGALAGGAQTFEGIAQGLYGTGAGMTSLAPTWPTSAVPTMGGYNYPVTPTSYANAVQAASTAGLQTSQAQTQGLSNLVNLGNLAGITGPNSLLGSGGLFGGNGLFSSLFGGGGAGSLADLGGVAGIGADFGGGGAALGVPDALGLAALA